MELALPGATEMLDAQAIGEVPLRSSTVWPTAYVANNLGVLASTWNISFHLEWISRCRTVLRPSGEALVVCRVLTLIIWASSSTLFRSYADVLKLEKPLKDRWAQGMVEIVAARCSN